MLGHLRPSQPNHEPGKTRDPSRFAYGQSEEYPQPGSADQVLEGFGVEDHPRIGQGEQGHDQVGNHRIEVVLELLEGGLGVAALLLHHLQQMELLRRYEARRAVVGMAKPLGQAIHVVEKALLVDECSPRNGGGDQDAGQRRVQPGLQKGQPQPHCPDDRVEPRSPDAKHIAPDEDTHEEGPVDQALGRNIRRIHEGDHEHGAHVVHYGQCGQKHLERDGHPVAEQRQDAERKGDVGRHGNAPALGRIGTRIERYVDRCGHQHTAQGRSEGHRRFRRRREFAPKYFTLDLESDRKEEERHQPFVDPVVERIDQLVAGQLDGKFMVPQGDVRIAPRGVRPGQGDERGDEQNDPRAGLAPQKARDGLEHPVDGASRVGRWVVGERHEKGSSATSPGRL